MALRRSSGTDEPDEPLTPTVLLVNDVASVGGGQTAMLDVASVLIAAGFETHLASPPGNLADESRRLGAEWHDFPYSQRRLLTPAMRLPRPPAIAARIGEGRRLAALAAEVGADVVHTGALVPHIDAAVGRYRLRARVLWHVNQVHPSYLFAAPLPDRIISVSRAALRPAAWRCGVRRRSAVVPNGVNIERFRPGSADERARSRAAIGVGDRFTVMTVSRLEPLKGVDTLIRAAARSRVNPVLVVIGDSIGFSGGGTYATFLRTLAEDLRVDARFLGSRPDVPDLLRAADLFALASRWEAFGLVLAEASASGLAVVSSNTGGCAEVVVDGSTGVLVEPDDIAGFAANFDLLAEDSGLRASMAAAGRERASREFDKRRLAERLLPHYLSLLR